MKTKLPTKIYVYWHSESDEQWLIASETIDSAASDMEPTDKRRVGVYRLVEEQDVTRKTVIRTMVRAK